MGRSVAIANVVGRGGRRDGHELPGHDRGRSGAGGGAARLDDAVRVKASKDALLAAGGVIAEEWQGRVPVLDANYRPRSRVPSGPGARVGASGSVAPRRVSGLPTTSSFAYAARLEFGDADRPPSRPRVPPSTRPRAAPSRRPRTSSPPRRRVAR